MFFSHGTNHSRGVLILVKDRLDFKLQSVKTDSQGRYILLEALIQDSPFVLLNIYAPNKSTEQCDFFSKIAKELKSSLTFSDFSLVVGGDFNVIFDQKRRCQENERIGQNTRWYLSGAGFDRYMACQKPDRETLYVATENPNYSETFRLLVSKWRFARRHRLSRHNTIY